MKTQGRNNRTLISKLKAFILITILTSLSIHWSNPQINKAKGAPFFKMTLAENLLIVSEYCKGIRIVDISDQTNPQTISYISIEGNADIAISGTTLYCDSYENLYIYDFSNPSRPVLKDSVNGIFKNYNFDQIFPDQNQDQGTGGLNGCDGCSRTSSVNAPEIQSTKIQSDLPASVENNSSEYVQRKYMSRFVVVKNYLYCVDYADIVVLDISNSCAPINIKRINIGFGIEAISLQNNLLVIGGQDKKSIFRIDNILQPVFLSTFENTSSTAPVVVEDTLAYITSRSGEQNNQTNSLQIIGVGNTSNPTFLGSESLTRPNGLTVEHKVVFVADGAMGVKIIDANNIQNMTQVGEIVNINVFNVMKNGSTLFALGPNGIYIYDCTYIEDPIRIGTIRAMM